MKKTLLLAVLLLSATSIPAQEWARLRSAALQPSYRFAPIVHDAARGRTILFGGTTDIAPDPNTVPLGDQWEFDGYGWAQAFPRNLPPARYQHAMCYDSLRQRVLLFGGRSAPFVDRNDLWAFDGEDWTQLAPTSPLPPPRRSAAMAYDSARDRVVLFGGVGASYYGDTWEFDGTDWIPQAAVGPSDRSGASIAFDPVRSVSVLSGGYNPGATGLDTTWEYDGLAWQLRSPEGMSGQFCFDANVGRVASPAAEWTGQIWTPTDSASAPLAPMPQLVFDAQRGTRVAFGEDGAGALMASVQGGSSWLAAGDPRVGEPVLDTVRGRLLGFGPIRGRGRDTIWSWTGEAWDPVAYAPAFSASIERPKAFDPVRDVVYVMSVIGGGAGFLTSYRGSDLQYLGGAVAPVASGPGIVEIVYDVARDRLVALTYIQGGFPNPAVMKTFEFDGVSWQENVTANRPPPRFRFSMIYDPVRQRSVMTGGFLVAPNTWEYDGVDWVQVSASTPQLLPDPALAFDPDRGRIVTVHAGQVWEYDGVAWTPQAPLPAPRPERLLGWDPVRSRMLAVADQVDCCTYESADGVAARFDSYGSGCAASAMTSTGADVAVELQAEAATAAPILGRTLHTRLWGGPPEHGIAMQMVGFDDQLLGGAALPLPLASLGGPVGCSLVLAPAFADVQIHAGTTQRFALQLPSSAALAGATFFLQGAVYDPLLAVPLPLATSNGLRCTVGL